LVQIQSRAPNIKEVIMEMIGWAISAMVFIPVAIAMILAVIFVFIAACVAMYYFIWYSFILFYKVFIKRWYITYPIIALCYYLNSILP
jgi:hypothetical protein